MEYFNDLEVTKQLLREIEERKKGIRKNPSDDLIRIFYDILYRIMDSKKFRNYTEDWKDEFVSQSIEKFLRNWYKFNPLKIRKNYYQRNNKLFLKDKNEWKGAHTFFSTIIHSSFFDIIRKFKKYEEFQKEMIKSYDVLLEQEVSKFERGK